MMWWAENKYYLTFIRSWYSPGYTSLLSLQWSSGTACRHVVSFNSYTRRPPWWDIINNFEWMFGLKATQHFYIYRLNWMEPLKLCCQSIPQTYTAAFLYSCIQPLLTPIIKLHTIYIFVIVGQSNTCLSYSS